MGIFLGGFKEIINRVKTNITNRRSAKAAEFDEKPQRKITFHSSASLGEHFDSASIEVKSPE